MVASSTLSSSLHRRSRSTSHVRTYNWSPTQLTLSMLIMLLASSSILGVFSVFVQTQNQLLLPIPWYFPYFMTVSGLTILAVLGFYWLIVRRRLLPAIVMIGSFVLFVLWITGLIVISVELFGTSGSISDNCSLNVFNQNPKGQTVEVLAFLQQKSICETWRLVFAMALIGTTFLLWLMIMAYQVFYTS